MTQLSPEKLSEAKTKLTQVFRYLQALDQIKNPVQRNIAGQLWTMHLHDFPNHPSIIYGSNVSMKSGDIENMSDETNSTRDDFIIKVRRPELTDAPRPPKEIVSWIEDGWQKIDGVVKIIENKTFEDEDGNPYTVTFEEDEQRVKLLKKWVELRNRWLETEKPARKSMAIFERLYDLSSRIERESEKVELIMGDGLLEWSPGSGDSIYHPILLQRVQLSFDSSIPEFIISNLDKPSELYTALFRSLPEVSAKAVSNFIKELEEKGYHPLGGDETSEFLTRFVTTLSPHGRFVNSEQRPNNKNFPIIRRDPVLFLRKRNMGFSIAIDSILEDIQSQDQFSEPLTRILGVTNLEDKRVNKSTAYQLDVNGEDENILLTKEANAEQLEIAQCLEKYGAVLVQGPPGTGKTHTIANLLGHLLSQGKSVLVTSHTAKALKVLRDKVIDPLQPLCVSVLDSEAESRKQLESSIDAIAERLSSLDPIVLEREVNALAIERSNILNKLRKTREKLKNARSDEYRAVVVAGKSYDPSEAARLIAARKEIDSWIPSPVKLGEPLPLSHAELSDLYQTNVELTMEEEKELGFTLPDPNEILSPSSFESLVKEREHLLMQDLNFRKDAWQEGHHQRSHEILSNLQERLHHAIGPLKDETEWRMAIILAGREGDIHRKVWDELLEEIEQVYHLSITCHSHILQYDPKVPEIYRTDQWLAVVNEIVGFLKQGGKISPIKLLFKPTWKTIIKQMSVNGRRPVSIEEFDAIRMFISLYIARVNLVRRWERQISEMGGPTPEDLGQEPEKICHQLSEQIQHCLNWYHTTWLKMENELKEIGFAWPVLLQEISVPLVAHAEIIRIREAVQHKIPAIFEAERNRIILAKIESRLAQLREKVCQWLASAQESEVIYNLDEAVARLDIEQYKETYQQLIDLKSHSSCLKKRQQLLLKLEKVAPIWAAAIRHREGIHGQSTLPGNPDDAWLWRQLHDELELRGKTSMEELQNSIANLSRKLREVTGLLVEKKAWAAQVRRTTPSQRQALLGWKSLIKKIGAGTGKRAPILRAEARKLMPVCQTAVPVWIMPINQVVENYDPRKNRFDVIIIDEASQSDVMALTVLYLGKQIVIVGDDQQVSPDAVGQKVDEVQQYIDTYLRGIPNKNLYDGVTSIYDLAKTSFEGMVQLREHFRCVPDIIQFSNHLSYEGNILPLRECSHIQRKPFTIAYRVHDAFSNKKVNEVEALHVASLLIAAAEQPEYEDATFGVISLVGDEQALRIDELLRKYMSPKDYKYRQIRCGNSAQFQGDERDVMFLSMVDSPTDNGPLPKRADDRFKKRFNVAASRARDQMWVVHSLDPEHDLKPGDLRRRLILHAQNPKAITQEIAVLEKKMESEFEKLVMQQLVRAGYKVIPQWQVGAYRIDMVVEGGGKRIAIECDGDKWHPPEKFAEDMARQAILERLGWRFIRIRGSQFFRDPEKTMQKVFEKIEFMGILPEGPHLSLEKPTNQEEIVNRIIRRASQLRGEWLGKINEDYGSWLAEGNTIYHY